MCGGRSVEAVGFQGMRNCARQIAGVRLERLVGAEAELEEELAEGKEGEIKEGVGQAR